MLNDLLEHLLDAQFGAKVQGQVQEYGSFSVSLLHLVPHGKIISVFQVLICCLYKYLLDQAGSHFRVQEPHHP